MIAKAVEEIEKKPDVISHIKHLIVDEYQDINRAQDRLINLIGKNASVFIVGDPRQCIYQWRGSDESCFEEFLSYHPDCEEVSIRENWRSVAKIVEIANNFADSFERRKYEHLISKRNDEGKVIYFVANWPKEEAEWIVNQIKLLMQRNPELKYRDFAILLRSVKTSASPFIKALKDNDMPFIVGGKVGLFKRDEAQAVGRLFAWLYKDGFWQEDEFGNKVVRGDDLLDTAIQKWRDAVGTIFVPPNLKSALQEWKRSVLEEKHSSFTSMFQELLVILGFLNLDATNKLHAAIMANLGRFNTLLTDYESSIRLGGQKPRWDSILKGLCWFMNTYAISSYEENPAEDIRGVDAVQIMTVHQAKGLEWPVVFVPCLTQRRFPSSKTGEMKNWFIPRDSGLFDVDRYEGDIEDEKRLFYVAITRARDLLCLSYFKKIRNNQTPSDFLSYIHPIISHKDRLKACDNLPNIHIKSAIDSDEILTFATSEIITYLRCPYLYCLREMWGFKPKLDIALGYGKSLHFCLRCASELIKQGKDPKEFLNELIEEKFHLPFAGGEALENMKKSAKHILTRFITNHFDDMLRIKEVEARLEFPLEKATIAGKVDVIIRGRDDNQKIEVRDYKTSDAVTTFEESSLQLQIYSLGLKKIKQPVEIASIAYLEQERTASDIEYVPLDDSSLEKAKEIAKKCIGGIKNSNFHPKCGNHCEACDYIKICRAYNHR